MQLLDYFSGMEYLPTVAHSRVMLFSHLSYLTKKE
jgi:hypothetical protein